MKKILTAFLILYTGYWILNTPVLAQQISLSISPPLIKLVIKPGKSVMIAYRVENNGDPAILSAKLLPFAPSDNMGNIRIKEEFEGPIRFSLDNADIVFEKPFFLKTKDSQQLLVRMRVPEGTPEGDYYYTLLAESQPPPTLEGVRSAGAKATIGSNILITVTNSGSMEVKGKVILFDVLSRWKLNMGNLKLHIFDSNDKIPVVLIVENKGINTFTPEGEIVLKGGVGETARYNIIPQNVLAQSQRTLIATPSAEIDCDNQRAKQVCKSPLSLTISGFFVGVYKLSTTINFGENSPQIFGSTSFVAIPFKLCIGFTIALVIGIYIIKKVVKKEEE